MDVLLVPMGGGVGRSYGLILVLDHHEGAPGGERVDGVADPRDPR